jgi:hypothetical protein
MVSAFLIQQCLQCKASLCGTFAEKVFAFTKAEIME